MIRLLYIHGNDSDKIPPGSEQPEWRITQIPEKDLDSLLPISSPYQIAIWHTSDPDPSFLQKAIQYNISKYIIVYTSSNEDVKRVKLLKLGAQDIINDAISQEEFILRMNSIIKRNQQEQSISEVFQIGNYDFNYEKRLLIFGQESRTLTTKESELLKMLIENKNKPVLKQDALSAIWGEDSYHNGRSMDVYIGRLRKYLQSDVNIQIFNIHGSGYKLSVLTQN